MRRCVFQSEDCRRGVGVLLLRSIIKEVYRVQESVTRSVHTLMLVQTEEDINRMELVENQNSSVMKFQGRCWNCNKIGHLAKNCRCSRDRVCESCKRLGHFAVCCRHQPEHASNKNHATSQRRTSLSTKGGGRREKVSAVSQQADGEESAKESCFV